jgi:fatty acid desaturase
VGAARAAKLYPDAIVWDFRQRIAAWRRSHQDHHAASAMKLHSALTINGKAYPAGSEIAWYKVYPFFLFHMLMFGGSGFLLAYSGQDVGFLYMHGGIAIVVYVIFYYAMFGSDEVRWMFINAGLGLLGIRAEIGWLLSWFGKRIGDYPWYVHVVPFTYYVLYTFLLRQMVLDMSGARDNPARKALVERGYVVVSLAVYLLLLLKTPRG